MSEVFDPRMFYNLKAIQTQKIPAKVAPSSHSQSKVKTSQGDLSMTFNDMGNPERLLQTTDEAPYSLHHQHLVSVYSTEKTFSKIREALGNDQASYLCTVLY